MTFPAIHQEDKVVQPSSEPFQKTISGAVFPLVLKPAHSSVSWSDLQEWSKNNQNLLSELLKYHGGILFRGFDTLATPKEFNDFVESMGNYPLPYVGGAAPRNNVYKGVFTSNESPPSEKIPFHHEMAQVPTYPSRIFFYAAKVGGATPILRSDHLYETIHKELPDFVNKLEKEGVVYTRVLPENDDPTSPIGRGWKSTYLTEDKKVAEEKAKSLGVDLIWQDNGNVKSVSSVLPAVKPLVHDTKRKVFFNSMVAAYTGWKDCRNDPAKAVTFGTGEPLDPKLIEKVRDTMERVSVVFPWEKYDTLCLDNNLCMHARQPFEGQRRTLAYVAK
jgi:Taurine catabolism dioxygenase TauD, TfdA family